MGHVPRAESVRPANADESLAALLGQAFEHLNRLKQLVASRPERIVVSMFEAKGEPRDGGATSHLFGCYLRSLLHRGRYTVKWRGDVDDFDHLLPHRARARTHKHMPSPGRLQAAGL